MSEFIYLAGGCFWGVEEYFSRIKGVKKTKVGYANGNEEFLNPTYETVCAGYSGYAETVEVEYNPAVISLQKILEHFFSVIDPLSVNKQGNDVGSQYRSAIFYKDLTDHPAICKAFEAEQKKHNKEIATIVEPLKSFYPAEEYHQHYLKKNPNGYCHINLG